MIRQILINRPGITTVSAAFACWDAPVSFFPGTLAQLFQGAGQPANHVEAELCVLRCQWHKREIVTSYLNETDKQKYRRRIQQAYWRPTYKEAKKALLELHTEIRRLKRSAANSMMEGFEETLTPHRLGVFEELGKSLKTSNPIESLNSQLDKYVRRVKHWMHSDQRQRWVAMGILEAETKMRRIFHPEHLPMLRDALLKNIKQNREKNPETKPTQKKIKN